MHLELVSFVCVTLESVAHFCGLEFTCFFINIESKWLKKFLWRLVLGGKNPRQTEKHETQNLATTRIDLTVFRATRSNARAVRTISALCPSLKQDF